MQLAFPFEQEGTFGEKKWSENVPDDQPFADQQADWIQGIRVFHDPNRDPQNEQSCQEFQRGDVKARRFRINGFRPSCIHKFHIESMLYEVVWREAPEQQEISTPTTQTSVACV